MATHYTIDLGYFSGSKFKGGEKDAWNILKSEVATLREEPAAIVREVMRVEPVHENDMPELRELASCYRASSQDLTLNIREDGETRYVVQCASGERHLKEIVRRAFCRLVIEAMHRHGIEVNLRVG